jgi:hypothetical protein
MKLIHQSYVKNGAGEVKVVPEEGEMLVGKMAVRALRPCCNAV